MILPINQENSFQCENLPAGEQLTSGSSRLFLDNQLGFPPKRLIKSEHRTDPVTSSLTTHKPQSRVHAAHITGIEVNHREEILRILSRMFSSVYQLHETRPRWSWRPQRPGYLPQSVLCWLGVFALEVVEVSVFQALKVLSDLVIEVDVYLSNFCYIFRCYRYPWHLLLPSGAWGNDGNGAHTMECVKTIQRAHVVINIVSNILNKVFMYDTGYVCSLGHCSRYFFFFFTSGYDTQNASWKRTSIKNWDANWWYICTARPTCKGESSVRGCAVCIVAWPTAAIFMLFSFPQKIVFRNNWRDSGTKFPWADLMSSEPWYTSLVPKTPGMSLLIGFAAVVIRFSGFFPGSSVCGDSKYWLRIFQAAVLRVTTLVFLPQLDTKTFVSKCSRSLVFICLVVYAADPSPQNSCILDTRSDNVVCSSSFSSKYWHTLMKA